MLLHLFAAQRTDNLRLRLLVLAAAQRGEPGRVVLARGPVDEQLQRLAEPVGRREVRRRPPAVVEVARVRAGAVCAVNMR